MTHVRTIRPLFLSLAALAIALALLASETAHAGAISVDNGDAACSDATGVPYCTIGAAVAAAGPGDMINVYPGVYAESVDLSTMGTPGDITLATVNDDGLPSPGTASIEPLAGSAIWTSDVFPGQITIDGFVANDAATFSGISLRLGDAAVVRNVTANGNAEDGLQIDANNHAITVENSTFNDNFGDGFNPFDTTAPLIVSNVTANGNAEDGMELNVSGDVTVVEVTANGSQGIGFGGDGIAISTVGEVQIYGVVANNNLNDGISTDSGTSTTGVAGLTGPSSVLLEDSSAAGNGDDGFEFDATGSVTVTRSFGFENGDDGFDILASTVTATDSRANNNGSEGFEVERPHPSPSRDQPPTAMATTVST
jgi:hypothetical protein